MKTQRYWLVFSLLCLISIMLALWLRGGTDTRLFSPLKELATDIESWFSKQANHIFPTDLADAVGQTASIKTPDTPDLPGTTGQRISPLDHTANDKQVCGRPPTKSRDDTTRELVYRWVDEQGQTHMADRRPHGRIASVTDLGRTKLDFTYEIIADGVSLPIDFQGQLAAGSKRMYDTWHFFLGEKHLRQSRIRLRMIGGPGRFDAYYANVAVHPAQVSGFYTMHNNEAVVKFNAADPRRNLAVTFHEISHLITAAHLGPTPVWLTEGLAEYFETMQVKGQSGAIHPNRDHIKRLQTTPPPSLRGYLAIDRTQWYGAQIHRNYAIAWSLVHFLLREAPAMYALRDVVKQAQENFCKPFSAVAALEKAYPGGIATLEADWRKWLAGSNFPIQQI